ncbi:hypothetical protein ACU635_50785 [[Actinomadura] parvosata]|uniref:hypothetical protein n=1 Tax=[Actinomadura] parvosata TaxID=1955412 RepID=UPI00406D472B
MVYSSPLRRWAIRRLVLVARWYGLTTTHEHDGNPLHRMHLLTATGHPDAVQRWLAYVDRIAQDVGRSPAKRRP